MFNNDDFLILDSIERVSTQIEYFISILNSLSGNFSTIIQQMSSPSTVEDQNASNDKDQGEWQQGSRNNTTFDCNTSQQQSQKHHQPDSEEDSSNDEDELSRRPDTGVNWYTWPAEYRTRSFKIPRNVLSHFAEIIRNKKQINKFIEAITP